MTSIERVRFESLPGFQIARTPAFQGGASMARVSEVTANLNQSLGLIPGLRLRGYGIVYPDREGCEDLGDYSAAVLLHPNIWLGPTDSTEGLIKDAISEGDYAVATLGGVSRFSRLHIEQGFADLAQIARKAGRAIFDSYPLVEIYHSDRTTTIRVPLKGLLET